MEIVVVIWLQKNMFKGFLDVSPEIVLIIDLQPPSVQ